MRGWKAREEAAKRRRIKTKISPEARAERKALYDSTKLINARPDEHYDAPNGDPVVEEGGSEAQATDAKPSKVVVRGSGKNKRTVTTDATQQPAAATTADAEPQQDSEGALIEE